MEAMFPVLSPLQKYELQVNMGDFISLLLWTVSRLGFGLQTQEQDILSTAWL